MRLSTSCYAVTGLGYSAPWFVNAGFIVGEQITLIVDTGANAAAASSIYGYALRAKPSNKLRAINTEKHFDHIGGNAFLKDRGVEIWGHKKLQRREEEFSLEISEFNDGIPSPIRRARNEANVFFSGARLTLPDHLIDCDQHFELGGGNVEVLLTPGHTPTNLSIWVPRERVLFCGDCLVNGYLPNLNDGAPEDWHIWLRSLDRIESLQASIVVPGHGAVARGAEVTGMLEFARETLLRALNTGRSPTAAPWQTT